MVYVTGDMHGDPQRLKDPALHSLRRGDTLLVCGDFGFIWDGSSAEEKRLRQWGRRKYTVAFIDGRHENFERLSRYPTEEWNGGMVHRINDTVVHLMRGEIYQIEEHTYFAFGGGESDDKEFRKAGESWWPEEMPTPEEMIHARENLAAHGNRVDYILTHTPTPKCRARLDRTAPDGVSLFLGTLEDTVTFRHWYFGRMHRDRVMGSQRRAMFKEIRPVD